MTEQRRTILKACAVAIIAYAIVVVIYSNLIPQLGVQFFVQQVQKLTAEPVDLGGTATRVEPAVGDRVVGIGGVVVQRDRSPLGTIVNTLANISNDARFPARGIAAVAELDALDADVAQLGEQRYVRIAFERNEDSGPIRFERWYAVTDAPLSRSLVSIAWLAMESVVFWLGWLIFRRRPEDDGSALFFLMCIVTVGAYMGWYHWLQIASNPALVFVFAACAMAVPPISLHFHLVTPTPKRIIRRFPRTTLTLLYVIPGMLQLGILWSISRLFYTFRHPDKSVGAGPWWESVLGGLLWVYIVVGALMFVGCLVSLGHSYLFPRQPGHRDQVRWLLGGSLVAALFIGYSLWTAVTDRASFLVGDATWAMFLASLAFAAAYAVSILRYRLFRIEEIVEQRGWFYLTIRLAGGITFYGLVIAVVAVTPRLFAGVPQPTALLIASFVVLVLYILTTIRRWLGAVLDRRFYRERSQLDWAIRRMNEAVGHLAEPPIVRHHVLVITANCVNTKGAALYQRTVRSGYSRVDSMGSTAFPSKFDSQDPLIVELRQGELVQAGPRPLIREDAASQTLRTIGAELAQPLLHDGKLLGVILLAPRREGMFNSAELAFLAGLADLATIALHSAQSQQTLEKLNSELRERVSRVSAAITRTVPETTAPAPPKAETLPTLKHVEALRGSGPAISNILDTVRKVAASTATVLIRGESGTGKSLLAEVIHRNSPRAEGPFIKVHCAALSPSLLESELFGHVKGAFTGAHRDKIGRFQMADRGTLFLDEIGDVSAETQTKLLRVLQEMTFEPVGSSESIRVDVRIIAATHQPLEELIRRGKLREDLFYRLHVISIRMPALRERREDIEELALHFLGNFRKPSGRAIEGFTDEALQALVEHQWPGNIRELENVIEHAVVMANGPTISREDLPGDLSLGNGWPEKAPAATRWNHAPAATPAPEQASATSLVAEIDTLERQRLIDALEAVGGNKSKAARQLGIPRSTLCSKLKKYRLA